MTYLFGPEQFLFPSLGPGVLDFIRVAYGALLVAMLLAALPHARRYFVSERWGGYAQSSTLVDAVQNPVILPLLLIAWIGAGIALAAGVGIVAAALVNVVLCRYFFIQMRWRGVLRGMGAPGFMAYWLGAAVLLLEYTRRFAPHLQGLALLALQADFAFIMLSAGMYKFTAGYRANNGMELGMVNPEWGYWSRFWKQHSPRSAWFRVFNQLAWGTEVVAALLMLYPPTRFLGGLLILVSFIFIATQIRLGFLCEMVIVGCLLFAHPGSLIDAWINSTVTAEQVMPAGAIGIANRLLAGGLWAYLVLLPVARAGLAYNFHARRSFPGALQSLLDTYANFFGLIIWRVFSADHTNFFVRIHEQRPDGTRRLISRWGSSLRYRQVAEAIAVTTLFTTLKYYPSNDALFRERLMRYARTVPHGPGSVLVFEYVAVVKRDDRFEFAPAAEYVVNLGRATVEERVIDAAVSVRAPAVGSPIHEAARPGSYAPASR
jgi:hypothetical protein